MHVLAELWLPIVVSAVAVFVASSLIHMLLPIHRGDYQRMADEDAHLDALRDLEPGQYMFPCPSSMKEMGTPEMIERYNRGPVGTMIVLKNGPPGVGASLIQWFVFTLVVGALVAHVVHFALPAGAETSHVFHLSGLAAFLGYGFSSVTDSIWKGLRWTTTLKFVFDGTVYALVTAQTFALMWPAA